MINEDNIIEHSKPLKLLYVEDNQDTRESTMLLLEEFFDDITIAIDGEDGLNKFKENKIDIIITDINMPKMDGLTMLSNIKEINSEIPVFISTAHNEANYFVESIKLSVDGYLLKPLNVPLFIQSLSKCIENIIIKKENLEYKESLEEKIKKQVDELREKDKLLMKQSQMASMGEMIDVIAHQWKQPLTIMKLQADIIECELLGKEIDKEYIKDTITGTKKQIDHLVDTIDEFRQFFRLNTDLISINLKSLFNSINTLINNELISKQTAFNTLCDEDIFINANENDIKHLFINLINNAKDEMVKSNIVNSNRVIEIECIKKDTSIIISISDNGKGIPNDIIDNIFKPHFTTKKDEGGTGIGLYMCKQIVDKYNGSIEVSSCENGTVFTVELQK